MVGKEESVIIRKHLDARKTFLTVYFLAFAVYIIIGLQPAQAQNYDVSGSLSIPVIGLTSDVTTLELKDKKLDTPDTIVGSYSRVDSKVLLIGHSTTVFQDLDKVTLGDEIVYNDKTYYVDDITTLKKEEISMTNLLQREDKDTLVVMTCAGELLGEGEATHRLIITASVR